MEKTRILVTGASGLLGRAVRRELASDPLLIVAGVAHSRARHGLVRADLNSESDIDDLFATHAPDVVVHCAAERRPDVSEKDPQAATRLNVEATRFLAEACRQSGAWLLHLSTDYVFDGTTPPYRPGDAAHPLNHYGATKLASEQAALKASPDALVLRVPVLFGAVESLDESAVTSIAKVFADPKPQSIDHWAVRYPTCTDDLAVVIAQIIRRKSEHPDFGGVYHWSGDEAFTKYEMALIIANVWQLSSGFLRPDDKEPQGAPRPRNCRLDSSALEALGIGRRTPFAQAIEQALEPFRPLPIERQPH